MTKQHSKRVISFFTALLVFVALIVSYSAGLFNVSAATDSTLFSDNSVILDLTQGQITITATGYTQNGVTTQHSGLYTVTANGTYTANKLNVSGYNGIITIKDATLIPNGNDQTAITVSNNSDVTLLFDNVSFENQVANSYLWGLIKNYYDSFRGLKVTDSRVIVAKAFSDFSNASISTSFKLDTKINIQNSYAYVYGSVEKVSVITGSRLYVYGKVNDYNSVSFVSCDTSCIYTKDGLGLFNSRKVNMYLPTNRVLTVEKDYNGTNTVTVPTDNYNNFSVSFKTGVWPLQKSHSFNSSNIRQATGSASTANAGYGSIAVANRSAVYMLNNSDFSDDYVFMPPILVTKINAVTPVLTLTSTSPVTYPGEITLTATLDRADATGTVEFYNGEELIGSCAVSGAIASLSVSGLDAGGYSITAIFTSSNNNYNNATSQATDITVNKATPTLMLSADKDVEFVGGTITLTASLTFGGSPLEMGTIYLNDEAMDYVADGVYQADISSDNYQTLALTAVVEETANYNGVSSSEVTIEFSERFTSIITLDPVSDITYGDTVTFTARVTGLTPMLPVYFAASAAPSDDSASPDDSGSDDSGTDDSTPDDSDDYDDSDDSENDDSDIPPVVMGAGNGLDTVMSVIPGPAFGPELTGTVTFQIGDTVIGTVDVGPDGTASITLDNIALLTAGGKTITATYNGNFAYAVANASESFEVEAKELDIEGLTALDKTYSETDLSVALSGYTLSGIVGDDDVSIDGELSASVDSDYMPGENVPVILTAISLTGEDASNYTINTPEITVLVNKAEFNLSNLSVAPEDRDYDASTTVYDYSIVSTEGTPARISQNLSGIVLALAFDSRNAGVRNVNVISYSIPSSITDYYNVQGSFTVGTAEIYKLGLGYEVIFAEDKIYDGNTDVVLSIDTLYGAMEGESPTATVTGYFYDKNAGNEKPVIITGITLDGDWDTNYYINIYYGIPMGEFDPITSTYSSTTYMGIPTDELPENAIDIITANIYTRGLTPSFSVATRDYNGTTNATISMTLSGAVEGEYPTGTASGHFETATVGSDKRVIIDSVVLDEAWERNYSINEYSDTTGTIRAVTSVDDNSGSTDDSTPSQSTPSEPSSLITFDSTTSIPLADSDEADTTSADDVVDFGDTSIPLAGNPNMGSRLPLMGVVMLFSAGAGVAISRKRKKK